MVYAWNTEALDQRRGLPYDAGVGAAFKVTRMQKSRSDRRHIVASSGEVW